MQSLSDYGNSSLSAMWDYFWQNARKERIPIEGHFELTPQCNLDCKMCYIHLDRAHMKDSKELLLEQWLSIIDSAIDAGMMFASLTGGECLTYPSFREIYKHLQSKGVMINVLTNGVLLGNMIDFFVKNPPVLIQVSVYGNTDDDYEIVTGKRLFQKVHDNIEKALEAGLPISIATTPTKYFKDVIPILKYYKDKNVSVGVNQWLLAPNDDTGRNLEDFSLSPEENAEISMQISLAKGEKVVPVLDNLLPLPHGHEKNISKGIGCGAGKAAFTVNWKGEMMLCSSIPYIAGSLLEESFLDLWDKAKAYADDFIMPIECKGCAYSSVCSNCPANHLSGASMGHCNPSICREGMAMVRLGAAKIQL